MTERIVFADGTVFLCPKKPTAPVHPYQDRNRKWKRITVCAELALVKEKFVDGAVYFNEWDSYTVDAEGKEIQETIRQELSEYSLAGDLVDTRDGNITVYMGKPTEAELLQRQLDAAAAAMKEGVESIG